MATYDIRLVYEAGPDPVTREPLGRDDEVVTVAADSPWEARSRALASATTRAMGRVVRAYDIATGQEVRPPLSEGFQPGRFRVDGLDGTYDGFTRGETWNGWAVPYFPLAEARRVADDYAAQPAGLDGQTKAEFDADRDLIRLYDPSSGEWDEYGPVEIGDGTGYAPGALYPVGAHLWTWEEA